MRKLPITPDPDPFDRILTGKFHSLSDFRSNRPNGASDWLIIQTIGGEGVLIIDEQSYPLLPGDIVLSRPDSPRRYHTNLRVGKWDLLWAHFHPRQEWLNWLHWPGLAGGWGKLHFTGTIEGTIQHRLRQMHHYASRPQGHGRHDLLAMNALEEVLLWCDTSNESRQLPMDGATQIAFDMISCHYAEHLSLRLLAQRSGQSIARLTRQFRKYVGSSPQVLIEKNRLERARQLLARTTLSIKEISTQTGFSNPFYFSIRFKAASGQSPSRYRSQMQKHSN